MLAPVRELSDAFAPGFIAARLQRFAHQDLHVFFAKAVFPAYICETDVVREGHGNDVAAMC